MPVTRTPAYNQLLMAGRRVRMIHLGKYEVSLVVVGVVFLVLYVPMWYGSGVSRTR